MENMYLCTYSLVVVMKVSFVASKAYSWTYDRASQRGPGGPPGVHSAISRGPHKNAMSAHMSASYKT